jgi:3-deoxy-manno-octulosonate cytidylyltransferase (CMP-KDO synthetase)
VNQTGIHHQTIIPTTAIAIIPARFDSTRLPGKCLLEIAGRPMICRVVESVLGARNVSRVIVATDDRRIFDAVATAGYEAMMTRSDHLSGTDRLAEVAEQLEDAEIIVNVQGDEPLIAAETIERAVEALIGDAGARIVTTWEPMENAEDVLSPDVVKIVVDSNDRAIYFSRLPVPYPREAVRQYGDIRTALEREPRLLGRFKKHTGLYVYRRSVLLQFSQWLQSELECQESLEQLRALEHNVTIKAIRASTQSIGVDTREDLARVRSIVEGRELAARETIKR